jgi:hypothetical protein
MENYNISKMKMRIFSCHTIEEDDFLIVSFVIALSIFGFRVWRKLYLV